MKNVLITGGNRGLGLELISIFNRNGYKVFTVVRTKDSAEFINKKFNNKIYPIIADLSLDSSVEIIREILAAQIDKLDILINNAGIPGCETDIAKVTSEEMLKLFNIHCLGVVRTTQSCLWFLKRAENPRIINVSSRLGSLQKNYKKDFIHLNASYSYRIAKAAQNMLSICLSQQLDSENIKVNSIHPGKLKTDSASSDADLEPSLSAERIFRWIEGYASNVTSSFVEPFINDLQW